MNLSKYILPLLLAPITMGASIETEKELKSEWEQNTSLLQFGSMVDCSLDEASVRSDDVTLSSNSDTSGIRFGVADTTQLKNTLGTTTFSGSSFYIEDENSAKSMLLDTVVVSTALTIKTASTTISAEEGISFTNEGSLTLHVAGISGSAYFIEAGQLTGINEFTLDFTDLDDFYLKENTTFYLIKLDTPANRPQLDLNLTGTKAITDKGLSVEKQFSEDGLSYKVVLKKAVPEPSSAILALIAGLGVTYRRRRKA